LACSVTGGAAGAEPEVHISARAGIAIDRVLPSAMVLLGAAYERVDYLSPLRSPIRAWRRERRSVCQLFPMRSLYVAARCRPETQLRLCRAVQELSRVRQGFAR